MNVYRNEFLEGVCEQSQNSHTMSYYFANDRLKSLQRFVQQPLHKSSRKDYNRPSKTRGVSLKHLLSYKSYEDVPTIDKVSLKNYGIDEDDRPYAL